MPATLDSAAPGAATLDTAARDAAAAARAAALAALAGLATLKAIMLAALFSRTPPYPPDQLAPFLAATLALAAVAAVLVAARLRWAFVPALLFAAVSLLSLGPHKLWSGGGFGQEPAIIPAVVMGSALIVLLAVAALRLAGAARAAG